MSSTDIALPALPTPVQFPFPYPTPYDIQLDLMRTVFQAIEERKIAIVESPTGTGKSLTLLTSTLSWLAANRKRLDQATEDSLRQRLTDDDPDDPPWVIEHALNARLADLRAVQDAHRARLTEAREKERLRRRKESGLFRGPKRTKVDYEAGTGAGGADGDEEFLPDGTKADEGDGEGEGGNLSKQVRELMAKYEAGRPSKKEEEKEEDVTKIYYTSRTHTQLRQLTAELLKTSFPAKIDPTLSRSTTTTPKDEDEEGVSLVPLASRRQLCINSKVQALGKKGGDERMNEACLDMQKGGKAGGDSGRCEFLPRKDDEAGMLDMRDSVLATVRDMEDIVVLGKETGVCPYYATRRAVKQSQLVTLPYNLLLQKNAREALDIDLTDQIVVIDEAHNLIDTLLSIHSTTLTASHISQATSQLTQYLSRFRTRLKPLHALWIRQTLSVLRGLQKLCETFSIDSAKDKGKSGKAEMLDTIQLMGRLGGSNDQVNLMEMVKYLRESKLARKVSGFAEKSAEELAKKATTAGSKSHAIAAAKHASIAAFHQVEAFLLSLTDARDDGRIILSSEDRGGKHVVTLKYMLLNPAERFKEVVESARCVILAGGTMEPISDFMLQLFPAIPRDRFSTLSCSHVIPKNNLLTQVVSMGPRKVEFEFKYANRGDDQLMAELGALIGSVIGMVPDGVVVFLPSYAFLDKMKEAWTKSGLLDRMNQKKQIFYEPQTSSEVDQILRDYAHAISSTSPPSTTMTPATSTKPTSAKGALLFAVVGGKLSEGINFSDGLGRGVIMVGLPFANMGSVELKERMKYVEALPGAGKDAAREMYENLCMRAVNQSIGRAIRHANDYATILLVDKRYATNRIRSKLPKWIGEDLQTPQDFAGVAKGIAGFFREKRDRGLR